jgi:eukaryotic-like serine/threonine-protein kinase
METGPLMKLGRYEVKEKIAAGGMATVYRAVQVGVGGFRSIVAIKILHPHLASDDHFKKMFLDEARIGALLNHRGLLNVLDYGEEEGVSYIVTEFFPSLSLEELAVKARKVPLPEALFILAEAAEGLEALHTAKDIDGKKKLGLVHRDISPHNVLIGHDGRVKVIDYGIVKREDPTEQTRAGLVKGKIRYMAPEQASGKPVEPATDLYSLAVLFLRCVTGVKPHGTGTTAEIMARARNGVELEPLAKKAKLPEAVSKVLEKLLDPNPKERHKSSAKLATEVRKVLAGEAPGYDLSTFQLWVEKHVKKKTRAPRSKAAKKAAAASEILQGTGIVRVPPSTDGIHPRWVFYGLATMFGVALLAHLLTALFSG